MQELGFKGAETATITDAAGRTPRDYYELLSGIWWHLAYFPQNSIHHAQRLSRFVAVIPEYSFFISRTSEPISCSTALTP